MTLPTLDLPRAGFLLFGLLALSGCDDILGPGDPASGARLLPGGLPISWQWLPNSGEILFYGWDGVRDDRPVMQALDVESRQFRFVADPHGSASGYRYPIQTLVVVDPYLYYGVPHQDWDPSQGVFGVGGGLFRARIDGTGSPEPVFVWPPGGQHDWDRWTVWGNHWLAFREQTPGPEFEWRTRLVDLETGEDVAGWSGEAFSSLAPDGSAFLAGSASGTGWDYVLTATGQVVGGGRRLGTMGGEVHRMGSRRTGCVRCQDRARRRGRRMETGVLASRPRPAR